VGKDPEAALGTGRNHTNSSSFLSVLGFPGLS
jgi:hypothetical protein